MRRKLTSDVREIERASWSQGIQTLISILIGAALSVAVGELQKTNGVDPPYLVRLAAFVIYCVGFFWFYHKFYVFFYRRASMMSVLLPSVVGSALIATAYTIANSRSFWIWSAALMAGSSYSTAATTFNCWRGKYMAVNGLPPVTLRMLSNTMLRSALFLGAMAGITAMALWGPHLFGSADLDYSLFAINAALFGIMATINVFYFSKPLERVLAAISG